MRRLSAILARLGLVWGLALAVACNKPEPARPTVELRPTGAAELDGARRSLMLALKKANALNPDRLVSHLSHVCSLEIQGKRYPIVDLRELVRGETTPRGVNAILVMDAQLAVVQRIEYTSQRPLFCVANRLYVSGDLWSIELSTEGNELTFDNAAQLSALQQVEANDVPARPPAGDTLQ